MAAQTNKSIAPVGVVTHRAYNVVSAVGSPDTDTPTNTVQLAVGATEGTRITKLYCQLRNTTAATRLLVFRKKSGASVLILSKAIAAYTWSTTADSPVYDFGISDSNPLYLDGAGDELWFGTSVAQATACMVVNAEGGKYA
jgi:hypothetical protein